MESTRDKDQVMGRDSQLGLTQSNIRNKNYYYHNFKTRFDDRPKVKLNLRARRVNSS
jgi:hypothetical protein